jgi:hypothetical protein
MADVIFVAGYMLPNYHYYTNMTVEYVKRV